MIEHVLCVVAVCAMSFAALRAAEGLGARGLEIPVAAAPLAVAAAIAQAMTLGLFGLGGSSYVLAGAAVLTALVTWRRFGAPDVTDPLRAWWSGLSGRERYALAAVAGAFAAWTAWVVKYPALGIDPLTYHLTESIRWVQEGTPGSVEEVQYEFPSGWYPITNEVFVGWLTGLGSSLAPQLLWTPATAVLFCTAVFLGLRRLDVPVAVAALAPASVLLIPVTATQLLGPHTDLPAFTWLAITAALAVTAARGAPGVLVAAVVAAGLAVGTKTTTAPLGVIALVAAGWVLRRDLRRLAVPLAIGAALAAVVGLTWYVRNLIAHGSPLWPFLSGPFGDPVPEIISITDVSFLEALGPSLGNGRWAIYIELFAGGLLTLTLGLLAPVATRTKAVLAASGAAAFATFAWVNAPFTGATEDPVFATLSLTTTRYFVPAITAGTVALALTARGRARPTIAVLLLACLWSYAASANLDFPGIPSLPTFVIGSLFACGVVWAGTKIPLPRLPRPALAAAAIVLAALSLSVIAHRFGHRQSGQTWLASAGVVAFMVNQDGFANGTDTVHFAPTMLAPLAGDSLQHTLDLIPRDEPCERTLRRRGWIVIGTPAFAERRPKFLATSCLSGERAVYTDPNYRVYFRGP